jgi:hypothetical protein
MKPTFEKTVDILVKAYLNDTLVHGNCAACAVGNIIAHALGTAPIRSSSHPTQFLWAEYDNGRSAKWYTLFVTSSKTLKQYINPIYLALASKEIDATGYTWKELARIEFAFESAPRTCSWDDYTNDEWMFNGLMAVVSVLAEIHGVSLEEQESAKLQFVKP